MARRRCAENPIATHEDLLDTVRSTDLCNHLADLRVVVSAVTTNDEERVLGSFGDGLEESGDKVLGVVFLLEDLDLLPEARAVDGIS